MSSELVARPQQQDTDTQLLLPAPSSTACGKSRYIILISLLCLVIIGVITIFLIVYSVFDSSSSSSNKSEMFGLWPCFGGNIYNQQTSPYPELIEITSQNIINVTRNCIYESPNGFATSGYPTIDDENNAYFSDMSGYITKINLENCNVSWRVNVAHLLGEQLSSYTVLIHQSLTLFKDNNNNKGILFGAPNNRQFHSTYPINASCYAVAVNIDDGSLLWKLEIAPWTDPHNSRCYVHGFFIDNDGFAFGGLSMNGMLAENSQYIGRFFKIDINKPRIVNQWYPFNKNLTTYDEYNMSYLGCGAWNMPAIIDQYVVFGTGNFYRTPKYVEQCLSGNFSKIPIENAHITDVCGNDKVDDRFWRCLEIDMYPNSLIVLNRHTFEIEFAIPLIGNDIYIPSGNCYNTNIERRHPFCPSLGNTGPDADLSALAVFRYNDSLYVAASQKPGQFFVFEIPSGKLIISKKFASWTAVGNFNMAVDEASMIGIVTAHGRGQQRYRLNSNMMVCDQTGSVHAIDLRTGNTLWQIVNPYGTINESRCYNDSLFVGYINRGINQSCEYGEFLTNEGDENINVVIPPIFDDNITRNGPDDTYPLDIDGRSQFTAPVTIIKDMVIVAGNSGDIWIHNLFDGEFIHHFQCPTTMNSDNKWNRAGIKGGISVAKDYIAFYCGAYWSGPSVDGNIFVSLKLKK
eukprot:275795_1